MKNYKVKFENKIITFVLAILCLLSFSFNIKPSYSASAINETTTNVLKDLQNDENFNADDYPVVENNYGLQVMQIAECQEGLLVYVYQPSGSTKDFRATTINISTSTENPTFLNYKLDFLNSSGVFYKYIIKGFRIAETEKREYEISSIFRKFDADIDEPAEGNNTISEVSYAVSKCWTVETIDGQIIYNCYEIETIEITDKYVNFIRYVDGYLPPFIVGFGGSLKCDSHFVAFSTDKRMDQLLEVDLMYTSRQVHEENFLFGAFQNITKSDPTQTPIITIKNGDSAQNNKRWLFGEKASWKRVQKVSKFIEENKDRELDIANLTNKEWVICFAETEVKHIKPDLQGSVRDSTEISDVSLLRLKFETNGKIYNLGVIDNKQTGTNNPSNKPKNFWDNIVSWFWSWFKWVLIGLVSILVGCLIIVFWPVFAGIFNGIWWFITLPFKAFKKRKK